MLGGIIVIYEKAFIKDFKSRKGDYPNYYLVKDEIYDCIKKGSPSEKLDFMFQDPFSKINEKELSEAVEEFLDLLFEETNRPLKKTIDLNFQYNLFSKYNYFGAIFSYYLSNRTVYLYDFISFLRICIIRFGIEKYYNYSKEEIYDKLNLYFYLNDDNSPFIYNYNEKITKPLKYLYFLEKLQNSPYDIDLAPKKEGYKYNYDNLYMYCEKMVYDNEREKYSTNTPTGVLNDYIIWVSKTYGDGYGFDVLSFDYSAKKEMAIEVKSRFFGEDLVITPNEYKIAKLASKTKKYDYYVYDCLVDSLSRDVTITKYVYRAVDEAFVRVEQFTKPIKEDVNFSYHNPYCKGINEEKLFALPTKKDDGDDCFALVNFETYDKYMQSGKVYKIGKASSK